MYLNMLYSKIPDPWGSALIRDYPFVDFDTLGRRISFLKEKLSEWCHQAYLLKKAKMIRKENVMCCKGNNMITVIGELKKPYVPKQNKFNKKISLMDLDLDEEDILSEKDQGILGEIGITIEIGIIVEERFIERTQNKQRNVDVMIATRLGIMLMNVLINSIKRKSR